MDVYQKNGTLMITAELPGLKPEDVEVTVEDGDLIIKGERKAEKEVKEKDYYRMERSYGEFYRRQPLPEGIKPEQITATFADGVLHVTIPASPEPKAPTHKVAIETK
jgi:HSP20 family protein